MKWLKLFEEFKSGDKYILLDGVSSSGKTTTTNLLKAKPFLKASKKDKVVVIGSDDFSNPENRIPYDHEGRGFDKRAGEAWHKTIPEKRRGDPKEVTVRGGNVGWPGHPHHKELWGDPRVWYMAQAALEMSDKTIVFDDIGKTILKYIPETKHILIHAPIPILLENVHKRGERNKEDSRDPHMVLDQYLEKYRAQKKKPSEDEGDPNLVLNKKYLKDLLSKHKLEGKFINRFIKELGIEDGDDYYIRVKRGYLLKDSHLINVDWERRTYLDRILEILEL